MSEKPIRVSVVRFGDRKALQLQYVDPLSGKKRTRTAGTSIKREAERAAAQWEAELIAGTYQAPSKVTWHEFRSRYEREQLPSLADRTAEKVDAVFNTLEKVLKLTKETKLRDVTTDRLSQYAAGLREGVSLPKANGKPGPKVPRSESTIAGHLAHIGAALRWAERMGLLQKAPRIVKPRRAKGGKVMKGRPVTGEEFERMLAKVPKVVGEAAAESWRHYLRGLWWSGLRLEESLELYWDRQDRLCVDLDGSRPMLRIPAELEKGHQDRVLPVAPEFAEFLLATSWDERRGRVFKPAGRIEGPLSMGRISRTVSAIGKAAGVKVNTDPKSGKVKFASAHDLRRSFGERWSARVMPQLLMQLMRHESIDTTMRFYVGRNAQTAADQLWAAYDATKANGGNTTGNTTRKDVSEETATTDAKSLPTN